MGLSANTLPTPSTTISVWIRIPVVNPKLSLNPLFHPFCMLVLNTNNKSGPGDMVSTKEEKIKSKSVFKTIQGFNIFAFEYTIFDDDDRKN